MGSLQVLMPAPHLHPQALSLASLSLVYQGRLAIQDAGSVAVLSNELGGDVGVAEASSSALLAISESRDGCTVLMEHGELVRAPRLLPCQGGGRSALLATRQWGHSRVSKRLRALRNDWSGDSGPVAGAHARDGARCQAGD